MICGQKIKFCIIKTGVGMALSCGDCASDWMVRASIPGRGFRFYSSIKRPDRLLSAAYGHRVIVGEAAGAEDHCPPSCVRIKNEWSLPLVPLYAFMTWSVRWSDCKTVVQFRAVVLVSVAISPGLR